jgi:hypothetical protein
MAERVITGMTGFEVSVIAEKTLVTLGSAAPPPDALRRVVDEPERRIVSSPGAGGRRMVGFWSALVVSGRQVDFGGGQVRVLAAGLVVAHLGVIADRHPMVR